MTCPRKYCLIDTCTNELDSDHPDALLNPEPDPDEDTEQYPTYQPPEPPSVAEQVTCIAGNSFMYFAVLTMVSAALQLALFSSLYVVTIIFGVAMSICVAVAAIAEQFIGRHKPDHPVVRAHRRREKRTAA